MTYLDAHSDWTFDLKVFRTYFLSGRGTPCPTPGTYVRRSQGDDEFLVYEVLNVVEHDVSRDEWKVEVRLVEKQREVELKLPFRAYEDKGWLGGTVIDAKQNWVMTQDKVPKGHGDIFGLGPAPEVGDIIAMSSEKTIRYFEVVEVESLSHPSNYDWRARGRLRGRANREALRRLKL